VLGSSCIPWRRCWSRVSAARTSASFWPQLRTVLHASVLLLQHHQQPLPEHAGDARALVLGTSLAFAVTRLPAAGKGLHPHGGEPGLLSPLSSGLLVVVLFGRMGLVNRILGEFGWSLPPSTAGEGSCWSSWSSTSPSSSSWCRRPSGPWTSPSRTPPSVWGLRRAAPSPRPSCRSWPLAHGGRAAGLHGDHGGFRTP